MESAIAGPASGEERKGRAGTPVVVMPMVCLWGREGRVGIGGLRNVTVLCDGAGDGADIDDGYKDFRDDGVFVRLEITRMGMRMGMEERERERKGSA